MNDDIRRFIEGATSAAAGLALCEQEIARLEAEVADLVAINRLLVGKLEWFAAYVERPAVSAPSAPVAIMSVCRSCASLFPRTAGFKTLCRSCRGAINATASTKGVAARLPEMAV